MYLLYVDNTVSGLLSVLCLSFDYLRIFLTTPHLYIYYFWTNCRFASPGKNRSKHAVIMLFIAMAFIVFSSPRAVK